MEMLTLMLLNSGDKDSHSVAKDAHSVVPHHIILLTHMAKVMVTTAMVTVQEEEAAVVEEDTKKLSKHLPDQVFQLAKANLKPVQVPIIQPTIGKEL